MWIWIVCNYGLVVTVGISKGFLFSWSYHPFEKFQSLKNNHELFWISKKVYHLRTKKNTQESLPVDHETVHLTYYLSSMPNGGASIRKNLLKRFSLLYDGLIEKRWVNYIKAGSHIPVKPKMASNQNFAHFDLIFMVCFLSFSSFGMEKSRLLN